MSYTVLRAVGWSTGLLWRPHCFPDGASQRLSPGWPCPAVGVHPEVVSPEELSQGKRPPLVLYEVRQSSLPVLFLVTAHSPVGKRCSREEDTRERSHGDRDSPVWLPGKQRGVKVTEFKGTKNNQRVGKSWRWNRKCGQRKGVQNN